MTLAFYVVSGLAACALVAATFAATADAYPNLPDKVPLHIGPDGCVNGRGPRAFIWMLPLAALGTSLRLRRTAVVLTVFLIATFMPLAGNIFYGNGINPLNTKVGHASYALQKRLAR